MALRALIFDVDGTLADTEREGHLPACNEAFARLGYPLRWTWEEFKAMLILPGSAARMRLALSRLEPSALPEEIEARVAALVELKGRLYIEKHLPRLPLRPGVSELVEDNDYTFGESFAGAALVARSLEGFRLDQLAALCVTPEPQELPSLGAGVSTLGRAGEF